MSRFARVMAAAGCEIARQWVRKTYWSRHHKTWRAQERAKGEARALAEGMSPYEMQAAGRALAMLDGSRHCRCGKAIEAPPTTCPDCKSKNQRDQFCRFCAQHFGPNTNRPWRR